MAALGGGPPASPAPGLGRLPVAAAAASGHSGRLAASLCRGFPPPAPGCGGPFGCRRPGALRPFPAAPLRRRSLSAAGARPPAPGPSPRRSPVAPVPPGGFASGCCAALRSPFGGRRSRRPRPSAPSRCVAWVAALCAARFGGRARCAPWRCAPRPALLAPARPPLPWGPPWPGSGPPRCGGAASRACGAAPFGLASPGPPPGGGAGAGRVAAAPLRRGSLSAAASAVPAPFLRRAAPLARGVRTRAHGGKNPCAAVRSAAAAAGMAAALHLRAGLRPAPAARSVLGGLGSFVEDSPRLCCVDVVTARPVVPVLPGPAPGPLQLAGILDTHTVTTPDHASVVHAGSASLPGLKTKPGRKFPKYHQFVKIR